MGFNGFSLHGKNKEQVNKQQANSVPRRYCGRMRQRPKALMLFSKTQYSVINFQRGPLLSDTQSVIPSLLGENNMERTMTYLKKNKKFKWAVVAKQLTSHFEQCRGDTMIRFRGKKCFDTAVYNITTKSLYQKHLQDETKEVKKEIFPPCIMFHVSRRLKSSSLPAGKA